MSVYVLICLGLAASGHWLPQTSDINGLSVVGELDSMSWSRLTLCPLEISCLAPCVVSSDSGPFPLHISYISPWDLPVPACLPGGLAVASVQMLYQSGPPHIMWWYTRLLAFFLH